ncbi:MAG: right-handed parallel beta-helix repeat-containing protein [Paracoccaceae bacterium]
MAKTITVSNLTELYSALKASTGGETILLEGGDYGSFSLNAKSGFDLDLNHVTITSADPSDPAVFSGLGLNGVSNLTIDNVVFDYTFKAGDASYLTPFSVAKGTNVTISNSVFDGDVASGVSEAADGYGYAYGLSVRDSTGVSIEGNEFHTWLRGAIFQNSTDLTVTGNEVHDIRSDGMNFADVQGVVIEDNYFHDFRASYASGDHRDMIQFWTTGTTEPSTDITIRSNTFDIGEGSYTQSIFMRNEEVDSGRAGTAMYYQNVVIEDNTIYNGHLHGITVGETKGLTIANNSVIAVQDQDNPDASSSAVWVPTIRVAAKSTDVEITGNAVASINGYSGQSGWSVKDNAYIQNTDPYGDGYYGNVFVSSSLDASNGVHSYVALPGGILGTTGAGSSETAAFETLSSEALYNVDAGDGGTRVFDAGLTASLLGTDAKGATYVWTFGDGSTATGQVVSHSYTKGDSYDVTLTVTTKAGRVLTADSTVTVAGSQVIGYDAHAHAFVAYAAGAEKTLAALTSLDGDEIQLGKTGTVASVSRAQLSALRGSDDFAIDFSLQADKTGTSGEVFRLHGSFVATVGASGALSFLITGASGSSVTLTTKGVALNDGAEHDISVQLDDGRLTIYVDGKAAAETAFSDTLPTSGSWDLSFGNPWGKANFVGDISAFEISVDKDSYAATPTSTDQTKTETGSQTDTGTGTTDGGTEAVKSGAEHAEGTSSGAGSAGESLAQAGHLHGGLEVDIASLAGTKKLVGAQVETHGSAAVLTFDGDQDYVNLGYQSQYANSDRIAFSVDFTRDGDMDGAERLVWNHLKLGLTLASDGFNIQVATEDEGFKTFSVRGLDLNDTDQHNLTVMVDTATDRLQVLLDDKVVMDVTGGTDFDFSDVANREWTLGTAWNRYFEGEVSGFHLTDSFDFVDHYTADPHALLS